MTMGESFPLNSVMSLLASTQKLLSERLEAGATLKEISSASDGEVEYDWLKKFAAGDVKDPSVNRVQRLHDYLVGMAAA